ncbi:methyltransferase [Bacillus alkalicellulosilyticus]|uniref:methyltransferase n=1 Tax=Alkalihalobacterium alkalicellulosilyticum TaxID=1912214 RepID=UPI000997B40F|nr:methyltransferase [Bacillus alkalicellulosilyticus]
MNEQYYDALLHIKTCGEQKGFLSSLHYHRYEATPYQALEFLFSHYQFNSNDQLVDFGCGKGRLAFFVNHLFSIPVIGIEMNETFYQEAMANKESYKKKHKVQANQIHFYPIVAETYEVAPKDNRFYFFNPFSVQIFMKVIHNILLSVEKEKREVELIIYYAADDYLYFLEHHTSFELKEEILLEDIYQNNPHERFLIYRLM